MAFDFPNTPAEGATYSPANGPQYIFKNGVWKQVTGGQSPVLTAYGENIIINGGFQVSQQNANIEGSAHGYYIADQWFGGNSGGPGYAIRSALDEGRYYGNIRNTAAAASPPATSYMMLSQYIEGLRLASLGWGTTNGIPAVLNLKVKAFTPGTMSIVLIRYEGSHGFACPMPIAAGEVNTWKEFTFAIPAPPSGFDWHLASGVYGAVIYFGHTVSSNYHASANNVWLTNGPLACQGFTNWSAVNNTTLQIADVQLLPDPNGTGVAPKYVVPKYIEDLTKCRRTYGIYNFNYIAAGIAQAAGQSAYVNFQYPVRMRIIPAVTLTSYSNSNVSGAQAIGSINVDGFRSSATAAANGSFYSICDPIVVDAR